MAAQSIRRKWLEAGLPSHSQGSRSDKGCRLAHPGIYSRLPFSTKRVDKVNPLLLVVSDSIRHGSTQKRSLASLWSPFAWYWQPWDWSDFQSAVKPAGWHCWGY